MVLRENQSDSPDIGHNKTLYVDKELGSAVIYLSIDDIKGYRQHARTHSKRQQKLMERSIREFGFILPILIDSNGTVIAGHLRLMTAKDIGYTKIPTIRITHLSTEQVRAYRVADNRLAELGEWDQEILAVELQDLIEIDFDVELTGFETPEIDLIIGDAASAGDEGAANDIPDVESIAVSMLGDLWLLDEHIVLCGDARDSTSYEALMQGRLAQLMISDVPYNLKISGNVSGLGKVKHSEFKMASGEMTEAEFEKFLADFVRNAVAFSAPGSVHYLFIDWRHLHVLERVCHKFYDTQLNLCVWSKSNGGMGSFYRSRHELILIFRNGPGPHLNNIQLGKYGRNRTNVWEYDGCSTGTKERRADLALHPTVKPAEMIADAIKDASKRGGLILDPFLGSGTTIIACEMTGRVGVGLELDPKYVDVIVRRWEAYTGGEAVHAETGLTFAEMHEMRSGKQLLLPPPEAFEEV
tara:strand:- start:2354 stop:3760 length:1407 start_codon:yes stop_codon:yes gene_type:complete